MLAHSLFFYFFSTIAVFSAVMVTLSRNTVYSVFFLILVFVSISILFIMIGAEFLGMMAAERQRDMTLICLNVFIVVCVKNLVLQTQL